VAGFEMFSFMLSLLLEVHLYAGRECYKRILNSDDLVESMHRIRHFSYHFSALREYLFGVCFHVGVGVLRYYLPI